MRLFNDLFSTPAARVTFHVLSDNDCKSCMWFSQDPHRNACRLNPMVVMDPIPCAQYQYNPTQRCPLHGPKHDEPAVIPEGVGRCPVCNAIVEVGGLES